jgi:hypothetical protein
MSATNQDASCENALFVSCLKCLVFHCVKFIRFHVQDRGSASRRSIVECETESSLSFPTPIIRHRIIVTITWHLTSRISPCRMLLHAHPNRFQRPRRGGSTFLLRTVATCVASKRRCIRRVASRSCVCADRTHLRPLSLA